MPSDAQMAAYAAGLPAIYRDIVTAFPAIEPRRKAGYGLAFQTLAMYFANNRLGYGLAEVQEACERLANEGFLEIKNEIFAHPTELGEQLIAAATGKPRAASSDLPRLPARTW